MMGVCATASADVAEALEVQEKTPAPTTQLRLEIGAKVIPHPDKVRSSFTLHTLKIPAGQVQHLCLNVSVLLAGIIRR